MFRYNVSSLFQHLFGDAVGEDIPCQNHSVFPFRKKILRPEQRPTILHGGRRTDDYNWTVIAVQNSLTLGHSGGLVDLINQDQVALFNKSGYLFGTQFDINDSLANFAFYGHAVGDGN